MIMVLIYLNFLRIPTTTAEAVSDSQTSLRRRCELNRDVLRTFYTLSS